MASNVITREAAGGEEVAAAMTKSVGPTSAPFESFGQPPAQPLGQSQAQPFVQPQAPPGLSKSQMKKQRKRMFKQEQKEMKAAKPFVDPSFTQQQQAPQQHYQPKIQPTLPETEAKPNVTIASDERFADKSAIVESSPMVRQERPKDQVKSESDDEIARREAVLIGVIRDEEAERQRRMEENERLDAREYEREASLIGTVVDEEVERQRRIDEDYETYTEPLEKTKAMEEIERRRRMYSKAEKQRQELAAQSTAKLFPNAQRPIGFSGAHLWNNYGLIKHQPVASMKSGFANRYSEFISTTTASSSATEAPASSSSSSVSLEIKTSQTPPATHANVLHKTSFHKPFTSGGVSEVMIVAGESTDDKSSNTTIQQASLGRSGTICKETYRSAHRPRLVVHHSGLSGKWQRGTESVELHDL
jgi:hypothetical protein